MCFIKWVYSRERDLYDNLFVEPEEFYRVNNGQESGSFRLQIKVPHLINTSEPDQGVFPSPQRARCKRRLLFAHLKPLIW